MERVILSVSIKFERESTSLNLEIAVKSTVRETNS